MLDINKVILMGRLGADPIKRQTKNGISVVHFPLATGRRIQKNSTEFAQGTDPVQEEETQWHQIVSWGRQGEACSDYLKKGHKVYVEGFIKSKDYEDRNGNSKISFEIHAEPVSFLEGKKQSPSKESEKV